MTTSRTKMQKYKRAYKPRKPRGKRNPYKPRTAQAPRQRLQGAPFPPIMYTKQNYSQIYLFITGAAGTYGAQNTFRMNSMWDFDMTGIGHSPYGRDELAQLYGSYKITAMAVDMWITNPTADGMLVSWGVQPPNRPAMPFTGGSPTILIEKPSTQTAYVNNTGSQKVHIKRYYPMYKAAQFTSLQYNANMSDFSAEVTTNPALVPTWAIACANLDGAAPIAQVNISFKFTLYTQWFQRKQLLQSP